MRKNDRDPALAEAIKGAGGLAALGQKLGVTAGAISQWDRTPGRHVIAVEAATGVHRRRLRPDLYPPEPPEAG